MPTLEQAIEKFQTIYNIPVDFKTMETEAQKFSFLENNLFETNANNKEVEYKVCLDLLLHSYIDSKTNMTAGNAEYDLSNFNIATFIDDFEEMMAVKNGQNPNRRPYEGLSKNIIGLAMDSLKSYDKSLAEIWADKVTKDKMSFEDFAAFADAENSFVIANINKESKEALKQRADNVYIAKKAMDQIWKDRSVFWMIIHPVQAVKEYNYKKTLNNCVVELHSKGFYYPEKHELASGGSMMRAPFEAARKASVKKPQTTNVQEAKKEESVLDQKATSYVHASKMWKDPTFLGDFQKQISNIMEKHDDGPEKVELVGAICFAMSLSVDVSWGNFNLPNADKDAVVKQSSCDVFKIAFNNIKTVPGMEMADKVVAAQKIANLMLSKLSPVASDDKYAEYADNYYLKNATPESIKEITEYDGNAQDLLNSARFEIGINDKLKMDLNEVVNDNSNSKEVSDHIDEKELTKSSKTLVE